MSVRTQGIRVAQLVQKRVRPRDRAQQHCFSSSSRQRLTHDGQRLVLGIETSCDDSCASLVVSDPNYSSYFGSISSARDSSAQARPRAHIISSIVKRQDHSLTGGIEPLNAAHEHFANLPPAIVQCLAEGRERGVIRSPADAAPAEIDAIAVTQGPGMPGCLSVGLCCAKMLATLWQKPLIYVHHMAAHALTPFLSECDSPATKEQPLDFPYLTLLLSGGHTLLVLVRGVSDFSILADTADQAIGNGFDKTARWLNVIDDWASTAPGAALEKLAEKADEHSRVFDLPVPFRGQPAFSIGGLLSAVQRQVEAEASSGPLTDSFRTGLARAFQQAAFAQLSDKLRMSLAPDPPPQPGQSHSRVRLAQRRLALGPGIERSSLKHVVVAGGVASNAELRRTLQATLDSIGRSDVALCFPPVALCTDNAAMIAHAGLMTWDLTQDLMPSPRGKWSLEELAR